MAWRACCAACMARLGADRAAVNPVGILFTSGEPFDHSKTTGVALNESVTTEVLAA